MVFLRMLLVYLFFGLCFLKKSTHKKYDLCLFFVSVSILFYSVKNEDIQLYQNLNVI